MQVRRQQFAANARFLHFVVVRKRLLMNGELLFAFFQPRLQRRFHAPALRIEPRLRVARAVIRLRRSRRAGHQPLFLRGEPLLREWIHFGRLAVFVEQQRRRPP